MARILYGVAGEGSGHSSRAREITRHLEQHGHEVKIISYDRGYQNLRDDFDVTKIFGLHFVYEQNAVQYLPTIIRNLLNLPDAAESVLRVRAIAETFRPQVILSDFEPISGAIANLLRIPLLSIDNQHRLTRTTMTYPKRYEQDAVAARLVTRLINTGAVGYIVTAFRRGTKPTQPRTFVVPPVLRREILTAPPRAGTHILVYLTTPHDALIDILRAVHRERFVVYGEPRRGRSRNITFRSPSPTTFRRDLASAKAVIANAGFTLMTEALHLGKPLFAVPVQHQFEQIVNAYGLAEEGYGVMCEHLTRVDIEAFLYNREEYARNLRRYPRLGNERTFRTIDRLIARYAKRE